MIEEYRENGSVSKETKFMLAGKVFSHTAQYDTLISNTTPPAARRFAVRRYVTMTYEKVQDMRYGENPHQKAAFYREIGNFDNTITVQSSSMEKSFRTTI